MRRKVASMAYDLYAKVIRLTSIKGYAPLPPLIIWEPLYKCNLRCKMCFFYGSGGTVPLFKDEMSLDEIKCVFRSIKKDYKLFLPRIHLTGGEPLIHKNFSEIVEFISKLGFKYSLTSNFAALSDKALFTLARYPPADLRISLDGPAEVHDKIRGVKGTFARLMKNLDRLRNLNVFIPVRFNCTICNDNIDYLDELVTIARKNKADLNFQHLMFLDENHINQYYAFCKKYFNCKPYIIGCRDSISPRGVERIIKKIKEIKKMKYHITFLPDLKLSEIRKYYLDIDKYVRSSYCRTVWSEARISPNGKMYPCFDYYFGDLRNNSFKDVWNGKNARRFRMMVKKRKLFPGCVRCCKI